MKYMRLPNTKLNVSRLCFGTGQLSDKNPDDVNLLVKAYKLGVNFWDTADCYNTERTVGKAMKKIGRENIIVQTKTDAETAEEAGKSIKTSLKRLQTHYIDSVLLHHIHTPDEWKTRQPAFKQLLKFKKKGIIKAVGFSTHSSPTAIKNAPKQVDIILASINEKFIDHGTQQEMLSALKKQKSKALLAMKILGEGRDVKEYKKRMDFADKLPFICSLVIGMKNLKELKQNAKFLS